MSARSSKQKFAYRRIFPVHLETKIWHFYFGGIGKIFANRPGMGPYVRTELKGKNTTRFT